MSEAGVNTQDSRMRVVLAGLELVSHGATQAWNPSGGFSGEPDDKVVAFVIHHEQPPHLRWRGVYNRQATHEGREAVITDATAELNTWTKRVAPRVEGKTLVELILEDGEGWDPHSVAQKFGVDQAYVRRTRMRQNRDIETGKPAANTIDTIDRPARARQLRNGGMTTRQIAVILDTHQTQVMRWIRATA